MKLIMSLVVVVCIAVSGCISPYHEGGGKYIKAAQSEVRSPFGTNQSFARLQRCDGPTTVVAFYLDADFTNCVPLTHEEATAWFHGYSQGQGGQIMQGLMNAGALGAVAATAGGSDAAATAGSATVTIINKIPKGGHH